MKKLPEDHRVRQARKAAQGERVNRLKRKKRRKLKNGESKKADHRISPAQYLAILRRKTHEIAPLHISFFPEYIDKTVEFINRIRHKSKTGSFFLDFSDTRFISAAGATYLYSELCLILKLYERVKVRISQPIKSHDIFMTLNEFGIFHLVNGTSVPDGDLAQIHAGEKDQNSDIIANFLVKKAVQSGEISSDPETTAHVEHYTHRAIQEAMLNVWDHAYPGDLEHHGWWVTAAILEEKLYIVLCDRGIGMPKTLPRRGLWEQFRGNLPMNSDAEMIEAAMEYTRTSQPIHSSNTDRIGRGLGTKDMQNLVLERKAGHMIIVSGKGHYKLDGSSTMGEKNTFKNDIMGTLIQWAIPLRRLTTAPG